MSLLTLGSVGIGRDLANRGEALAKDATVSKTRIVALAPPGAPPSVENAASVASFGQLLVAQIPGEALIAYTTLLALFSAGGSAYKAGRWVVYVAAIVVCAAVVLSSYFAQRDYEFDDSAPTTPGATNAPAPAITTRPKLHLPILPTIAAMGSMAVYGLTVPGSPLQFEVSNTAFGICSGCLAVGGGVMMSIFAPFLGKGNSAKPVTKQQ